MSHSRKSISIYLLKPTRRYTAGETIYGKVVVTSDQVREIKKIVLNVEGTGSVGWTETIRVKRDTFRKTVRYGEETYLKEDVTILKRRGDYPLAIPEGRSCYSFSYKLPHNIPSTFSTTHAQIRYRLQVRIERPLFKSTIKSPHLTFSVRGVLNLHKELKNLKNNSMTIKKTKSSCCFWSCRKLGPIRIEASVARRGFIPGETISFDAFITNMNVRRTIKVTAYLVQHTTYKSTYGEKKVKSNICVKAGPLVHSETNLHWNGGIEIPISTLCTMLGSTKCSVIQIRFRLVIRLDSRGKTKIKCEFPIYIGTGAADPEEDPSTTGNSPMAMSYFNELPIMSFPSVPRNDHDQPLLDTYVSIEVPDADSNSTGFQTSSHYPMIEVIPLTNSKEILSEQERLSLSNLRHIPNPIEPSTSTRSFLDPLDEIEIDDDEDAPPSYEEVIHSSGKSNIVFSTDMID